MSVLRPEPTQTCSHFPSTDDSNIHIRIVSEVQDTGCAFVHSYRLASRAHSEHVVDSVRNFGSAVAIGNTDRLHHRRTHTCLDCFRHSGRGCPVAEPPRSLSTIITASRWEDAGRRFYLLPIPKPKA